MIVKIDHIGIAVRDLAQASQKYEALTGQKASRKEVVASQEVETEFFRVGESRLELLEGTEPGSTISQFVDKRGGGVHHICFEVQDLTATLRQLSAAGFKLVNTVPEDGAGGSKVAFIHPKSTGGVLIEFVEYPK